MPQPLTGIPAVVPGPRSVPRFGDDVVDPQADKLVEELANRGELILPDSRGGDELALDGRGKRSPRDRVRLPEHRQLRKHSDEVTAFHVSATQVASASGPVAALRLGNQELVTRGFGSGDFREIPQLIARGLDEREAPCEIGVDVEAMRRRLHTRQPAARGSMSKSSARAARPAIRSRELRGDEG